MEIGTYPITDPIPVQVITLSGELDASNYLDVIERVRALYEACLLYTSPSPRD